jgi:hypothetical protein
MSVVDETGKSHTSALAAPAAWANLAYSDDMTVLSYYLNGSPDNDANESLPSPVIDVKDSLRTIGVGFTDFMWSFCVTNRVVTSGFDIESGMCSGVAYCADCPTGECLHNCEIDQTMDTEVDPHVCVSCDPACTDGCIRRTDCRVC